MSNEGLICDALLKTDPALYLSVDGANSFKASIKKRGSRVSKYRKYVDGEHDATMTDQMRAMLRLKNDDADLDSMNINYMALVVDKMAGRLNVESIESDDEKTANYIKEVLDRNDFESIQGMMWRGAVRDGDSYAMVDPLTMKWTVEPAYDGFSGVCAIMKQGQDFPVWACKLFSQADLDLSESEPSTTVTMKVTVYQPSRITYWKAESGTQQVESDGEEKQWALGSVPVVHYANAKDSYTQYGESEIRKAKPAQDIVNRTLHSMVMASEFSAFKVAYSIGVELDKSGITPGAVLNLVLKDQTGKVLTELTADQIEWLKAVRIGELEATDITQYTNQLEKIVMQITQITSTPIYGVTFSGNLSGEALKQLEIGLVGKCQRFQKENSAAVKQLIELTANMQRTFANSYGNPPKIAPMKVVWGSPEIRDNVVDKKYNETQIMWQTIANVQSANPYIPTETILKSFGKSDSEIKDYLSQKEEWVKKMQEDVIPTEKM